MQSSAYFAIFCLKPSSDIRCIWPEPWPPDPDQNTHVLGQHDSQSFVIRSSARLCVEREQRAMGGFERSHQRGISLAITGAGAGEKVVRSNRVKQVAGNFMRVSREQRDSFVQKPKAS